MDKGKEIENKNNIYKRQTKERKILMKDIAFIILLILAPILPFCLFADDEELDNCKRPPAEHKPSSTIGNPGSKKGNKK